MTIEIVDFPIKNGGSFQLAMLNYQRVLRLNKSGLLPSSYSSFKRGAQAVRMASRGDDFTWRAMAAMGQNYRLLPIWCRI